MRNYAHDVAKILGGEPSSSEHDQDADKPARERKLAATSHLRFPSIPPTKRLPRGGNDKGYLCLGYAAGTGYEYEYEYCTTGTKIKTKKMSRIVRLKKLVLTLGQSRIWVTCDK